MNYTFYSRKLDREITFSRPGSGYVYIDLNGQSGTLGNQICAGGSTMGSTITYYSDDYAGFVKMCKAWWGSYLRGLRENGI